MSAIVQVVSGLLMRIKEIHCTLQVDSGNWWAWSWSILWGQEKCQNTPYALWHNSYSMQRFTGSSNALGLMKHWRENTLQCGHHHVNTVDHWLTSKSNTSWLCTYCLKKWTTASCGRSAGKHKPWGKFWCLRCITFLNKVNKKPCHYTICDIQFIIRCTYLHS